MKSRQEYLQYRDQMMRQDFASPTQMCGWKCYVDSVDILFDSRIVKVRYHIVEGDRSNIDSIIACRAVCTREPLAKVHASWYLLVPDGFSVYFEHNGSCEVYSSRDSLWRACERYWDMFMNPAKYY